MDSSNDSSIRPVAPVSGAAPVQPVRADPLPKLPLLGAQGPRVAAVTGGILLGGFAGVSNDVGQGLELQAIAACVIGGTQLMGGGGTVLGAVAGALTLFALFTLLNLLGLPEPLRVAIQGAILIAAMALGSLRRGVAANEGS